MIQHPVFTVGKKLAFHKLVNGFPVLQLCATAFTSPGRNYTDIEKLDSQAMAFIFCGKYKCSLAALCYNSLS